MRLTFLGTGTSGGVPSLGCTCEVCRSTDPHDKRLRCVALVENADTRLLIDCGPDIRQQLMPLPFLRFDGVLLTHVHYDHVGGIDDLRPYCRLGDINIYADQATADGLHRTMPYCFTKVLYPGVPRLDMHVVEAGTMFHVGSMSIMPIRVMHGKLPILGYRIGSMAYITDMKSIEPDQEALLGGVATLIVSALRYDRPHHSHQLVDDAIAFSRRVGARTTYLIHSCHNIGLHAEVERRLPDGFHLAYDGQVIEC